MSHTTIKVWDPAVRLFHWSLLIAFAVSYLTQEENYDLHLLAGYAVLGLVAFRILWGFVGTRHARFSSFLVGPRKLLHDLRGVFRGQPRQHLGHNPPGGWMIVALLLILLLITASGIALDAAENRAGPLADFSLFLYTDWIQTIHQLSSDLALVLVTIHILGVIVSGHLQRENLVLAMITGKKHRNNGARP